MTNTRNPCEAALEAVAAAARHFANEPHNDDCDEHRCICGVGHLQSALTALDALHAADGGWRHKKRGTTYQVVGTAEVQVEDCILEGRKVVVYRAGSDGTLWVRPTEEFYDGRFEKL